MKSFDHAYDWFTAAVILTSTSLFFAIARSYKVNRSNTIDSVLLALLSLQALMSMFVTYLTNQRYSQVIAVTGIITMGIPHAALVLYILYIISKKIRNLQHLKRKCQCLLCWTKYSLTETQNGYDELDTDSLPDRLVNPDEYEPLIPAVNQRREN